MVGANTQVHVHGELDGLPGAHLGDEDVWVDGDDCVLAREVLILPALGGEGDVLGIDMGVVVGLEGVRLVLRGVGIYGAGHIEVQLDCVVVLGVLALLVEP